MNLYTSYKRNRVEKKNVRGECWARWKSQEQAGWVWDQAKPDYDCACKTVGNT